MCQYGHERRNMPRGTFVFQKSSVLPTTVTVAPRYCAYAAVAMLYGPAPITKSAVCSISILLQTCILFRRIRQQSRSRCPHHKRGSQHHVTDCETLRSHGVADCV